LERIMWVQIVVLAAVAVAFAIEIGWIGWA
jgi:hypothetical protein